MWGLGCFALFNEEKTLKHVCQLARRIKKWERLMLQKGEAITAGAKPLRK